MPPWPAIISAHQHWLDGPIEADEGSQEEDGSDEDNTGKDEGNKEDKDENNDNEQEHIRDNAPAASATSVDGMFVFLSWYFFIFYFTFLLGSPGM